MVGSHGQGSLWGGTERRENYRRLDELRHQINGVKHRSQLGVVIGLKLGKRRYRRDGVRQDAGHLLRQRSRSDVAGAAVRSLDAARGGLGLDVHAHHLDVRVIALLLQRLHFGLRLHRALGKGVHDGLNLRSEVVRALRLELEKGEQVVLLLVAVDARRDGVLAVVLQQSLGEEKRVHAAVDAVGLLRHLGVSHTRWQHGKGNGGEVIGRNDEVDGVVELVHQQRHVVANHRRDHVGRVMQRVHHQHAGLVVIPSLRLYEAVVC